MRPHIARLFAFPSGSQYVFHSGLDQIFNSHDVQRGLEGSENTLSTLTLTLQSPIQKLMSCAKPTGWFDIAVAVEVQPIRVAKDCCSLSSIKEYQRTEASGRSYVQLPRILHAKSR